MILYGIFKIFSATVAFLMSFLPDANIPDWILDPFVWLVSIAKIFDFAIDFSYLFTAIAFILSVESAIFIFKVSNFTINKIRGSG